MHVAAAVRELAEQRAEERRLAAAVGAEHAGDLARPDGEVDAAEHVLPANVAAAQVARGHERGGEALAHASAASLRVATATAPYTSAPITASAGPGPTLSASATHTATTPSTAASAIVPSC